jgi:hypothetical protein
MNTDIPSTNRTLQKVKRAWLITWEFAGNHAAINDKFAAIISWRFSDRKIREIVEQIYVSEFLSLPEQIAYSKNKRICPHKVQYSMLSVSKELQESNSLPSQIPFAESMIIGGNPWLWARIVYDLEAWIEEGFTQHLKWKEREELFWGINGVKFEWREYHLNRDV